jgi:hypothetical protein
MQPPAEKLTTTPQHRTKHWESVHGARGSARTTTTNPPLQMLAPGARLRCEQPFAAGVSWLGVPAAPMSSRPARQGRGTSRLRLAAAMLASAPRQAGRPILTPRVCAAVWC